MGVTAAQAGNIAEELTKAGATTLVDLVVKAGLAETLSTSGPFTVFAPDNDAFARLGDSVLATLGSDVELLKKVLLYHVVSGNIYSSAATNNAKLDSVQGAPILVNLYLKSDYYDGFITINGKKVMKADMKADNGVIHCVSDVLFPIPEKDLVDTLVADERFSTLVAAVTAAGLVDTVREAGSLTIFAPTNDAFSKVPSDLLDALLADPEALKAVLLRHVLPGSQFSKMGVVKMVSYSNNKRTGARVEEADIIASNGVIQYFFVKYFKYRLLKGTAEVRITLFFSRPRVTSLPKFPNLPPTLTRSLRYVSKSPQFMIPSSTGWLQSMENFNAAFLPLPDPMVALALPFKDCFPGFFLPALLAAPFFDATFGAIVNRYSALLDFL